MDERTRASIRAIRREFSRMGWALFTGTLVPAALSVGLSVLGAFLFPGLLNTGFGLWMVGFFPMYGVGLPLAMAILRGVPEAAYEKKRLSAGDFWTLMAMVVPITMAGSLVGNLLAALFSFGRAVNPMEGLEPDGWTCFSMLVLAPVMEELLFRKILLDRAAKFGERNAIVLSALAFSLFHANLYQMVYAFGLGLLFGYVYQRTHRIGYTMAMHFLVNFFGGLVGPALMMAGQGGLAEFLPMLVYEGLMLMLAALGTVFLAMHRREFRLDPAPWELPRGLRGRLTYGNAGVIAFLAVTLIETGVTLIQSILYY